MPLSTIAADRFAGLLKDPSSETALRILDVRNRDEFNALRLKAAVTLRPLGELDAGKLGGVFNDKAAPLYILCKAGPRADTAARRLAQAGYENPVVISGGIIAVRRFDPALVEEGPPPAPRLTPPVGPYTL